MYKFSFNNLPKSNSEKKRSLLTQTQYTTSIMKCGYCSIEGHNISECPIDRGLDKILNSYDEPEFSTQLSLLALEIQKCCRRGSPQKNIISDSINYKKFKDLFLKHPKSEDKNFIYIFKKYFN